MNKINTIKYNLYYWIVPVFLLLAVFVIWSPRADAGIVIEGDRQFTDDINNCLNTYRNAEGVVGDAIRELENSDNEHKIIKSTDWSNTSNDLEAATGGSGSGTVTRVDKDELEKLVKEIEALKHKDFCTAFLHEFYHALDADRGTRTPHSDKVDGVKRNEVEATAFQNFIHAIRGVPPRTHYGGRDISHLVVIGGESPQESTQEEENTEDSTEEQEEEQEEEEKSEVSVSMTFEHVVPGEYSEVYVTVVAEAGTEVEVKLIGPGVDSEATQTQNANDLNIAHFTWRITSYGQYVVIGKAGANNFNSAINVE